MHRRFRRGYRNVINEALRLNAAGQDCQLAIETSGHAALKENYFLDDGAYLVTRFLMEIAAGRSLESLLEGLYEPVESREFRLKILAEDFRAAGTAVLDSLAEYAKEQPGWSIAPDNCEGVRVNLDKAHGDGWFLLRLSLHDRSCRSISRATGSTARARSPGSSLRSLRNRSISTLPRAGIYIVKPCKRMFVFPA